MLYVLYLKTYPSDDFPVKPISVDSSEQIRVYPEGDYCHVLSVARGTLGYMHGSVEEVVDIINRAEEKAKIAARFDPTGYHYSSASKLYKLVNGEPVEIPYPGA